MEGETVSGQLHWGRLVIEAEGCRHRRRLRGVARFNGAAS